MRGVRRPGEPTDEGGAAVGGEARRRGRGRDGSQDGGRGGATRAVLDRVPLFRDMTERDLDAIGACLARRPFAAGEELIRQGVWRGELLIISTGVVEVIVEADEPDEASPDRTSREVTLRRLTGGECVGEMSLLTGTPPSATVRALTDGEAWILGQTDFLQLAMAHPALSRNVNAILSERLLHANRQQIAEVSEQILLVVEGGEPRWTALATAMAQLSRMSISSSTSPVRWGHMTRTPTRWPTYSVGGSARHPMSVPRC